MSLYRGTIYSVLKGLYQEHKKEAENFFLAIGDSVRKYEFQKYLKT
jgi:hypothetical protein